MGDVSFCAMQFPTPEKHTSQDEDASDPSRTTIRRWEKRDLPSRTLSWLAHGAKGPASWLSSPAEACSRALLVRGLAAFCGAVRCGAAAHSAVPEESHHGVVVVGLGLGVRAQGYGLAQVPGPPVITTIDVVKTETGDLFPRSKGSSVQPCKVSNSPGSTPTLRHYDCADPLFVDKSHAGAASWHGFHFHVFAWQSPGALTSWCQVARHTPPPGRLPHAPPTPTNPSLPFPRSQSPLSSPHLHLHLNSIRPRCNPPGAWARASGSSPLVRHPTCQHPCMQPFLDGITALKSLEVLQPGAPVLARKAVSPLGKGYLPQGRSRVLIRGAT